MWICEQIGDWAAGLQIDHLSAGVCERAELQALSIAAARAAGEQEAAPFAAVAPDGPVGEVYRSAAASIAHDWDDYLFMGHTGHSAVPAAAAFSDDSERVLLARVAANEVAGRLGAALFLGPHNGQFWASIHCASAAVAGAVGMGLDARRTAQALAIALYQPPYGMWPGFMGPQSKLLTAAEPAAAGARAALLAADGVSGALDVIEHPRGVLANLSFAPRPAMFRGLGEVWLTDTLAFKRLPGCAYLQSIGEAACAAGVDAAAVAEVEIDAGWLTCEMESLSAGSDLYIRSVLGTHIRSVAQPSRAIEGDDMAEPARIRCYERAGLAFDVIDDGPLDGPPVVLLHGFPQRATSWAKVAPLLGEAGFRTYAPDQRGYAPGARPRGRRAYKINELVGDVVALISRIDTPVHLVGHDWGATVAWYVAARHPNRLASLTAVSVGHPEAFKRALRSPDQARRSWYMGLFQLPFVPERLLSGKWFAQKFLGSSGMTDEMLATYQVEIVDEGALTGGLNWYRAIPFLDEIPDVSVPTTFVWSDGDTALRRRMADLTEEHIDGPYEFVELAGASHWIPEERPADLAEAIISRAGSAATASPATSG